MARAAIARRPFEYRIHVARLARQIAVHAVEFEAGRQMIERDGDGRRLFGADRQVRQQQRQPRDASGYEARFHDCFLLNPRAFPRIRGVTALALHSELPQMPIILVMAGIALLAHFSRARWVAMARRALQLAVRAEQRKVRILGVIEPPELPAIRRVAGLALLSQCALVHVLARMAADAGGRRCSKRLRRMALGAAHQPM